MLRGMDNFGHGEDDGESESSTVGNIVSVNHPTDVGIIPDRRESRDTDTESFTYEHFPVVCPTCRGVGQVHEGDNVFIFSLQHCWITKETPFRTNSPYQLSWKISKFFNPPSQNWLKF